MAKLHRVMRTLSEVFAPGAPTLPEGLRTLVVSPDRELEPGMTVRASFTFRNQGGAPATGVRVRFNLPDGLVYLVGTGELDGANLDDEHGNSPLLSRSGAHIGDVSPGEERRIEIAYSVAGAIENGTTIELQAAVASFEVSPVGSNIVRLIARSRPQLSNNLTGISIESRSAIPTPGSEAQITLRIHNAGESSARDVVVVAPIPEHTTYVPNSARVNGREVERDLGMPFDRVYAPIVTPALAASASTTVIYRVRVVSPLDDGTRIAAHATVASQETPAFALEAASLVVRSAPDFADDRTAFTVEPSHDVRPGQRLSLLLSAYNAGSAAAESVSATLDLPDALLPVRGSASIDGRPLKEGKKREALTFDLGRIDAGEKVDLRCEAVVMSPLADDTSLAVAALLRWEPSADEAERRFERSVIVRSVPALPARRNAVARVSSETVRPGEEIEAEILLGNDGSAPATDVVLHLRLDPALDEVRVTEKGARVSLDADTAELGALEPYSTRRLAVRARLRTPYADRSEIRIGASAHTRELGETPLGEAIWRTDSHPSFSPHSSTFVLENDEMLRPNQLANVLVRLTNVGSDVAHNVRVRLYVSPEARLETVDGATREKSKLVFGEIPPGATAEARLGLRLLRSLAKEFPVTVDAVLTADAMLPVPLERMTIVTTAEPDFSVGTLRSEPIDVVDAGETIEWTLHVRNGGDGPARRVHIFCAQPESLIYVPNSTTVNDVPIRDVGATSALASERGIVLNDVDPGVEATIVFRDVVHNGLPAGEAILRVARVRYDGERDDEIVSNELKVRATPVFANAIPGLPFGLDGMIGPSFSGGQRALTEDRFMELPPATPVNGESGHAPPRDAWLAMRGDVPALASSNGNSTNGVYAETPGEDMHESGIVDGSIAGDGSIGVAVTFTGERHARILRFLDEARFDGLITHVFALRAFFPEFVGDGHLNSVASMRDALREELDRLFIKLRLPNYVIAPRDIETPSLRATLERLTHDLAAVHGAPADTPNAALVLRGNFDADAIAEMSERLSDAELASALPWAIMARMLPDGTAQLAHYRAMLVERLDSFVDMDASEFLDALQRRRDVALDAALDVVRTSLHANAM